MRIVIIESPYAGKSLEEIEWNVRYARAALLDCLNRGEAPFASHLLYTQVLDDTNPDQRGAGILAGLAIGERSDATVVYDDLGISPGMVIGMMNAHYAKRPIEHRSLPEWKQLPEWKP